jgi:hypothetical protein
MTNDQLHPTRIDTLLALIDEALSEYERSRPPVVHVADDEPVLVGV